MHGIGRGRPRPPLTPSSLGAVVLQAGGALFLFPQKIAEIPLRELGARQAGERAELAHQPAQGAHLFLDDLEGGIEQLSKGRILLAILAVALFDSEKNRG